MYTSLSASFPYIPLYLSMSSHGPVFRFLINLGAPVLWRFASLFTGIAAIMDVARSNNLLHNQEHHQQLKACEGRKQILENDRLSELPEEVLINILSFLSMKEAGRTSVLSKSWRNLWAYIPTLNFDSSKLLDEFKVNTKVPKIEGPRYANWVNQVVRLYKAPTIDEFRVRFDTRYFRRHYVDNLFIFAMDKKAKRIEVDLSLNYASSRAGARRHTLKYQTFCNSLTSSFCNNLTSLALGFINITGEILESMLCNCQALEYLSVKYSDTLLALKVTGKSLSLKTLRIEYCNKMKQLEISAPNLVHVIYIGLQKNMELKIQSTPKLSEVCLGGWYADDLANCFSDFRGCLSQIEALSLLPTDNLETIAIPVEGPVFTNLMKLDLEIFVDYEHELDGLELLLKVCPVLHHFKLQLIFDDPQEEERDLIKQEAYPHDHLKIVEIVGFAGIPVVVDIATFLIESAVSLDKIILDPRDVLLLGTPREFIDTLEKRHAREQATMHLGTILKPDTELQIRIPKFVNF